jgi:hypothetical protein
MQAGVLNFEVKIFPCLLYCTLPVEIAIVPSVKPPTAKLYVPRYQLIWLKRKNPVLARSSNANNTTFSGLITIYVL